MDCRSKKYDFEVFQGQERNSFQKIEGQKRKILLVSGVYLDEAAQGQEFIEPVVAGRQSILHLMVLRHNFFP